jgi:hypothetical protein
MMDVWSKTVFDTEPRALYGGPCSIVRKPNMWSNDRFSIMTTTWSILRRFFVGLRQGQETVSFRSIPACLWPGTEQ